jgi:uncharacterized protein (DUF427 family)
MTKPRIPRIEPGPGQESVWDYPRPPRIERSTKHLVVEFAGRVVADTRRAIRILETSSPPTYYVPPQDVRMDLLVPTDGTTFCEWKGLAGYADVRVGDRVAKDAAWSYPSPNRGFGAITGWVAFYPARVDACSLDGERVRPQEGVYYGGWITDDIVGPFKGGPGTTGW